MATVFRTPCSREPVAPVGHVLSDFVWSCFLGLFLVQGSDSSFHILPTFTVALGSDLSWEATWQESRGYADRIRKALCESPGSVVQLWGAKGFGP